MFQPLTPTLTNRTQGRLLTFAALFLALYSLALTLAPAVRLQSWNVSYPWSHWLGLLLWLLLFIFADRQSARWLPDRDPYLLPLGALLSGWGMLTIWRLYPAYGVRQTIWLALVALIIILGVRLPSDLSFLRRYKYLWLTGGLLLTGLTLIFGTNPLGYGPRMWLGCCGFYLQPSEPLKLLLVIYLAAYLADRFLLPAYGSGKKTVIENWLAPSLLPLLAPTLVMTGLALLLLVVQRDLGTASIFIFLYAATVYIATGRKRILVAGGLILLLAALAGYWQFDVVRVRIDAWLNPWLDPSGRSFQIVQSLLAVASGGILGRGPGLGSPKLVPVAHSDFIFASIAEEGGLFGAGALLLLIALLSARGVRAALRAPDAYRRYLAAGLTAHLVGQSVLIIGGNLRLLPLTGVTLPFVSYGGSSLVTSFLSLLLLMHISQSGGRKSIAAPSPKPYLDLGGFLLAGLAASSLALGWWAVVRGPALLARTDNPRRAIADRYVPRGAILDRNNTSLEVTQGEPGDFTRQALYPPLSPVLGYTDLIYGQAGLEASLDPYLRGLQGNPSLTIWWHHLLYGEPPPGLNVRLSLDLPLQKLADEQLGEQHGALVLLNSRTGEILIMASHPGYDSNDLVDSWQKLIHDPNSPLLNRATQGLYPPGAALGPLLLADANAQSKKPLLPGDLTFSQDGRVLQCALQPKGNTWEEAVSIGCPGAVAALGRSLGSDQVQAFYRKLGLFRAPSLRLPADSAALPTQAVNANQAALGENMQVSPLQMALAAAALSADGVRPAPLLVAAVNIPTTGWVPLQPLGEPEQALQADAAALTTQNLDGVQNDTWQSLAVAPNGPGHTVTWFLGGTTANWEHTPLTLVVLLEQSDPSLAAQIGQTVLQEALLGSTP